MKQLAITKTTLLSIAGILLSIGVTTITGSNNEAQKFMEGAVEIILGIVLIAVREYCKTIPENGSSKNDNSMETVQKTR